MIETSQLYHDLYLDVYQPEGMDIEHAISNHLLFSIIEETPHAITCMEYLVEAMNFYNKTPEHYPLKLVDEESYTRLYNSFLELRTDRTIETMQEESDTTKESEEEFSLTEFLHTSSDILTSEESAPIIKFVNAMLYQAVKRKASDIHIEAHEKKGEVRFRIDGVLTKITDLDNKIINLVVSRIKVISHLDISEKRIPQDGRTQLKIAGRTLDVRVSVLPTFYGERVVMRILMQGDQIPNITDLGFAEELLEDIRHLLKYSHGIILVTGPTGSGKTTSLHSFLKEVESPDLNLITVEDPVEYKSDNISQIQVNEKVGLTFASALRSILRQDPDVIMIGEIRDEETANIAVRAALTGHLVFSTLHTNSSPATISRLSDMGIEPFLISSSILGILAQRLVRQLCDRCKEEDFDAETFAETYDIPADGVYYKAKGCNKCNYTGYSGRRSVGELLTMDDDVKMLLRETTDEQSVRSLIKTKGFISISDQLKQMLISGKTSLDEAIRIGLAND